MKEKYLSFSGIRLHYFDTETPGRTIVLAHANGYAAGCYRFYIESLKSDYRVLALDFAGHGESETTLNFHSWFFFRDQILYLLSQEVPTNEAVFGIGHSLGGASVLLAARACPERFQKVIALDPVVLGWKITTLAKIFGNPLARQARSRRRNFQSIRLVERAFRKFPAFANWDPEIWQDYLTYCIRKTGNGEEVELCCDPEVEARIFSLSSYRVLIQYYGITVETHILIPEKYEVCSPSLARLITRKHPKSSVEIWKEASHFFPFEWKERTLERIRNWLKD